MSTGGPSTLLTTGTELMAVETLANNVAIKIVHYLGVLDSTTGLAAFPSGIKGGLRPRP